MSTLSGRYPSLTYGNLLQIDNNNAGLSGSLVSVQDGLGNNSPLQLSATACNVTNFSYNGFAVSLGGTFSANSTVSILGSFSTGGNFSTANGFTTLGGFAITFTATGATSVTLPTTGTLGTLAGAETLSNKTLVAPILGTPASGALTYCTSIPLAQATGNLAISHFNSGTNASSSTYWRGDGTWVTAVGGDALTTNPLSQFASTTSAQLRGVLSDETGTGAAVFATSPTLVTPTLGAASATSINGTTIPSSTTLATTTQLKSTIFLNTIGAVSGASVVVYMGSGFESPIEATSSIQLPFACIISNLYTNANTTSGAGQSYLYTVYQNGVPTAITSTAANVQRSGDESHSITCAQGDTISVQLKYSASATTAVHAVTLQATAL